MANGLDEAVLIVVIGYRLGAAGFFSLPELRKEYARAHPPVAPFVPPFVPMDHALTYPLSAP